MKAFEHFRVESNCIGCAVCREIAPTNFSMDAEENYAFIAVQPDNEADQDLCREALEICPVDAINCMKKK